MKDRSGSHFGKGENSTSRSRFGQPRRKIMADALKMKQLIWDCEKDIAAYLPDESGISEHELVQMLIARLDGSQAKEALGVDWQGWWPDDDGGGDGGSPAPQDREMA